MFIFFRHAQIASVDSMMTDDMAALIGPVNNFAMTRVLTFTAHWDILHLTPGAISTALRVSYFAAIKVNTKILFHTRLVLRTEAQ